MSKSAFIIAILIVGLFAIVQNVYANALPEPQPNPVPSGGSLQKFLDALLKALKKLLGETL